MCGIYKITNLINQKSYIGQSVNIETRWKKHRNIYNKPKNKSYNYPLYKAFRKYGIDKFSFEIIEECLVTQLNERERYWVSYYNTFFQGYNQTLGGDSSRISFKKDVIISIINDLSNTTISQKLIARKYNISEEMVQGINTGRYWHHDRVYPIRTTFQPKTNKYCVDCGKEILFDSTRCAKCQQIKNKKESKCPNTKEELEQTILNNEGNFAKVAKLYGVSRTSIARWCVRLGISPLAKDYQKKIKEDSKKEGVQIAQCDILTNEVIAIYSTGAEASKSVLGNSRGSSHIIEVCKGIRQSAYKYKWKYI